MELATVRHDWTHSEVKALFEMPFNDLLFKAATVHRANFNPNQVQISTLLSIKTGACPEDCKYCPQSGHYKTDLERERLLEVEKVVEQARLAKQKGATRFCMGAAWSDPKDRDMPYISKMVKEVKELGLETCMTLGKLTNEKAHALSDAGLDYYNHNLDTSPEYYEQIISTRTFADRLNTIDHVRDAGMKVCSGPAASHRPRRDCPDGPESETQNRSAAPWRSIANCDHGRRCAGRRCPVDPPTRRDFECTLLIRFCT